MQEGKWYYCCLAFGWVIVGRASEREGFFGRWLEDARFITNAGTNHGEASVQGLRDNATTNPVGVDGRTLISPQNAVWISETPTPYWAVETRKRRSGGAQEQRELAVD